MYHKMLEDTRYHPWIMVLSYKWRMDIHPVGTTKGDMNIWKFIRWVSG
jgi:hypothetical protein